MSKIDLINQVLIEIGFVYGILLAVSSTKNELDRNMGVFTCVLCGVFLGVLLMSFVFGTLGGSNGSNISCQPQHTCTIIDVQPIDSIQIYKYQVNLSDGKMDTVISVNKWSGKKSIFGE